MVEELLAARGIIVSHETVRAAKREIMPGIEHRQRSHEVAEIVGEGMELETHGVGDEGTGWPTGR